MIDYNSIILIVPPIITAAFAYMVARKKNIISERLNKAKIDADIQNQALTIVRGVMNDMRDELRKEIDVLRKENEHLKEEVHSNRRRVELLESQLEASAKLVETLKAEILTLQTTLSVYKDENERLKNK